MYGYDLPGYVRDTERQIKRYDRQLRLRRSLDQSGKYIVERRTHRTYWPDIQLGTDRAVQYKDGYRTVMLIEPRELKYLYGSLVRTDVRAMGGAMAVARQLDADDQRERDLMDRRHRAEAEEVSSEVYDYLAWHEGRRVAMGGHGVAGN